MAKYKCDLCGHIYDEAVGDPANGIAAGTLWTDLPESWSCPVCGQSKSVYERVEE